MFLKRGRCRNLTNNLVRTIIEHSTQTEEKILVALQKRFQFESLIFVMEIPHVDEAQTTMSTQIIWHSRILSNATQLLLFLLRENLSFSLIISHQTFTASTSL